MDAESYSATSTLRSAIGGATKWHSHNPHKQAENHQSHKPRGKASKSAPNEASAKWGISCYSKTVYYVYILGLRNRTHYVGFSSDLKTRLKTHRSGKVPQTKLLRPIKLLFYAAFVSKKKATDFEKYLKTNSGFAFRNKRLILSAPL